MCGNDVRPALARRPAGLVGDDGVAVEPMRRRALVHFAVLVGDGVLDPGHKPAPLLLIRAWRLAVAALGLSLCARHRPPRSTSHRSSCSSDESLRRLNVACPLRTARSQLQSLCSRHTSWSLLLAKLPGNCGDPGGASLPGRERTGWHVRAGRRTHAPMVMK